MNHAHPIQKIETECGDLDVLEEIQALMGHSLLWHLRKSLKMISWKKLIKLFQPFLGTTLSLALVFQSLPTSAFENAERRTVNEELNSQDNFNLLDYYPPSSLAKVTDSYLSSPFLVPRSSFPLVINIQDLHCHPGVQKKISQLLEYYSSKGVTAPFVAVEGAQGPVDTSLLALFPDEEIKKESCEKYLQEGVLTGMEDYAIKHGKGDYLWGVDDEKTYKLHKELFKQGLAKQSELFQELSVLEQQLRSLQSQHYSSSMRELDRQRSAYQQGTLSLAQYLRKIRNMCSRQGVAFPASLEQMAKLLQQEKHLPDQKTLRKDTQSALRALYPRLSDNEQDKLSHYSRQDNDVYYLYLHTLIRRHRCQDFCSKSLKNYLAHTSALQKINVQEIQSELDAVHHRLLLQAARTQDQKALAGAQEDLMLLKGLVEHKLTQADLKTILPRMSSMTAFLDQAEIPLALTPEEWKELLAQALDFYALALLRDKPLVEQTLGLLDNAERRTQNAELNDNKEPLERATQNRQVAILVTGGFHSAGVARLLKEKRISYLVVSPGVDSYTPEDQKRYLDRLLEKPLDQPEFPVAQDALGIAVRLERFFVKGGPVERLYHRFLQKEVLAVAENAKTLVLAGLAQKAEALCNTAYQGRWQVKIDYIADHDPHQRFEVSIKSLSSAPSYSAHFRYSRQELLTSGSEPSKELEQSDQHRSLARVAPRPRRWVWAGMWLVSLLVISSGCVSVGSRGGRRSEASRSSAVLDAAPPVLSADNPVTAVPASPEASLAPVPLPSEADGILTYLPYALGAVVFSVVLFYAVRAVFRWVQDYQKKILQPKTTEPALQARPVIGGLPEISPGGMPRVEMVPAKNAEPPAVLPWMDLLVAASFFPNLWLQSVSGNSIFQVLAAVLLFRGGFVLGHLFNEWGHLAGASAVKRSREYLSWTNVMAHGSWLHWAKGFLPGRPWAWSPHVRKPGSEPETNMFHQKMILLSGFAASAALLTAALFFPMAGGIPSPPGTPAIGLAFVFGLFLAFGSAAVTDLVPAVFPAFSRRWLPALTPGVYFCGIAGLVAESLWWSYRVLKEVMYVQQVRGGQGGGISAVLRFFRFFKSFFRVWTTKSLNPKGLDLPQVLARKFLLMLGMALLVGGVPAAAAGVVIILVHLRVGTRGAGKKELHTHQLHPNGAVIGHNGDNDALRVGKMGWLTYRQVRRMLDIVFFVHDPTEGDSPPIAGELDLLNAQRDWKAAVRWAYVETVPESLEVLKQEYLTKKELAQLAAFLGRNHQAWQKSGSTDREELVRLLMENMKTEPALSDLLRRMASQHRDSREAFLREAVTAYYDYSMDQATKIFLSRVSGSYGLGVITAQQPNTQYILSLGQTVSVGFTEDGKKALAVSDPSALKTILDGRPVFRYRLDLRDGEILKLVKKRGERIAVELYAQVLQRSYSYQELQDSGRVVDLWGSPYITPLPPRTRQPVQKDVSEIAAVVRAIDRDWDDADSDNRKSAAELYQTMRRCIPLSAEERNRSTYLHMVFVGKEDSLEAAKHLQEGFSKMFPDASFRTAAVSSEDMVQALTKALEDLTLTEALEDPEKLAKAKANFTVRLGKLVFSRNTIFVDCTQSGDTSSTKSVALAYERIFPGQTFGVTGELDTEVATKALQQGLGEKDPFSRRIFTTLTGSAWSAEEKKLAGRRPAETASLSLLAQRRTLKHLLWRLASDWRRDVPEEPVMGMILQEEDLAELKRVNAEGTNQDLALITGQSPEAFVSGSAYEGLRSTGRRYGRHLLDDYYSTIAAILVFAVVHFTFSLPYPFTTLFGWIWRSAGWAAEGWVFRTNAGLSDVVFYFIVYRALFVWAMRRLTGRQTFARLGGRAVRIGGAEAVHDALAMFFTRILFSNMGFGIASGHVKSQPFSRFLDKFGPEVNRGTLVLLLAPDNRLKTQDYAYGQMSMSGSQARIPESLRTTAEVTLLGYSQDYDPNTAQHYVRLPAHALPLRSRIRKFSKLLEDKHHLRLSPEQLLDIDQRLAEHLLAHRGRSPALGDDDSAHDSALALAGDFSHHLGLDNGQSMAFNRAFRESRQLLLGHITTEELQRQAQVQDLHETMNNAEVQLAAGMVIGLEAAKTAAFRNPLGRLVYGLFHSLSPVGLKRVVSLIFLTWPFDRSMSYLKQMTTPSPSSPAGMFSLLDKYFPKPETQAAPSWDGNPKELPFEVLSAPTDLVMNIPPAVKGKVPALVVEYPSLSTGEPRVSLVLWHQLSSNSQDARLEMTVKDSHGRTATGSLPLKNLPALQRHHLFLEETLLRASGLLPEQVRELRLVVHGATGVVALDRSQFHSETRQWPSSLAVSGNGNGTRRPGLSRRLWSWKRPFKKMRQLRAPLPIGLPAPSLLLQQLGNGAEPDTRGIFYEVFSLRQA